MQRNVFSKKRLLITTLILIFWFSMVFLLIQREYFSHIPLADQGYKEKLKDISSIDGKIQEKEESMDILFQGYREVKIGTIRSLTKANLDGTYELSSQLKISIAEEDRNKIKVKQVAKVLNMPELEGQNLEAGIQTLATIGPDYQLKDLKFRFKSNLLNLSCEGEVETGKLILQMQQNGDVVKKEINFPPGTVANSGFESIAIPKNIKTGDVFNLRWFDPLTQQYRIAKSEVMGQQDLLIHGKKIPVHVVHTKSGSLFFDSWVDETGEVIQYQVGSFVFRKPRSYYIKKSDESSQPDKSEELQQDEGNDK